MGDTVYAELPDVDTINIENFFVTWQLFLPNKGSVSSPGPR
jgi:hypothetical protein